jgi:hypothetical protein
MGYEPLLLIVVFMVFFVSPQKAVITLAASIAFWIEWTMPGVFGLRLGLVDVAVIGGLFGMALNSTRNQSQGKVPFMGLIISYMLISMLSPLLSPYIELGGLKRAVWVSYKEIFVTSTFILFYWLLSSKDLIQKTINLVLLSATLSSVVAIVQSLTNTAISIGVGNYGESISRIASINEIDGRLRAFGTLWHANEFAGFLILTLSVSIALFLIDKECKLRKYLPIFILTQGFALILSLSSGGWLGIMGSVIIILSFSKLYKQLSLIPIVIIGIILTVSMYAVFPKIDLLPGNISARLFSIKNYDDDPAMLPRFARWNHFLDISMERPIIGLGTVTTEVVDKKFMGIASSPHNTYLSVAVKRGYIALIIIVTIIMKLASQAKELYKSGTDSFFRALGLGTFAGLCGLFGIAGMFGSFLEETQVNILFWLLLAVILRCKYLDANPLHVRIEKHY